MVFIHGACTSSFSWHHQLKGLGSKLNVVALELCQGTACRSRWKIHRWSGTPVKGAMEHLKLGQVFLAGHSLGGAVAQAFALKDADRLKGLILISTFSGNILDFIRGHSGWRAWTRRATSLAGRIWGLLQR